MHIKQITISNFRSFRQQEEVQPFCSTTNCVVGRNGSGKSNLFDAIQFVLLAPRFASLQKEERQALLHEGSGSAAINAFVEVVFDNSDNRFSLENSDEVVLRRTVGAKKDEFFLQRKSARKHEVQSLLEGAGFSKSNPYFMVQQGKIQTLCVMTDAQRLQLLQQVAGTTVYEQKKAESVAKMQENEQSIDKIDEILSEINQRLEELQGEKEELTVYQQADRQRKAIEYTLYDKELRKARHALDHLETERMEHVEELTRLHEQSKATHDAIQQSEGQLHVKSQALKRNHKVLKDLEGDKTQTVRRKTQLALQCQELEEQIETSRETMQRAQAELVTLEQGIAQAKTQLTQVEQQWTTETQTLRGMKQNVELSQRELDGLYARQSRGSKFATKAERDASLHRQIADLTSVLQDKQQQLQGRRDALGNARRTIVTQTQDVETQQAMLTKKQESMQSLAKSLDEQKRTRLLVLEQRKQTWRSAEQLEEQVREARSAWHEAHAAARKSMPRATSFGIGALEKIVREERLVVGEQYFGMVLENMTLKDPKYQTAVEIAAQNALFHVVVDTDATAARLMQRLEDGKLGRVTFLPLTKLRTSSDETLFPRDTQDVTNLLETCINYPPVVRKAMQHVFDRKLLARSSDAALEWSTRMQMDAITLEGDLCSRKGALSGGYIDPSQSRLKAFAQQQAAKERYAQVESEYKALDQQATQSEQEATNLGQAVQHLQHKQTDLTNAARSLEQAIEQAKSQVQHSTSQATKLETLQIPPLQEEVTALEAEVARLRDELGTELTATFSEEDRTQLNRLKQTIATVRQDIQVQTDQVDQVSMEREKLKSLLKDNLLKRKKELLQAGRGTKEDDDEDDNGPGDRPVPAAAAATTAQWLEVQTQELQSLQEQLHEVEGTLEELEERLDNARQLEENTKAELLAAKNELEGLRNEDLTTRKELDAANETEEKLMGKKTINVNKRETYIKKIQELGSLPPTAELEHYKSSTIPSLMKSLEKVNKKLKQYSHVNKKAFDQFVSSNEQREGLLKRKEELDRGAAKVRELIENLDQKKDEAINRTFRGVSAHFKDVFNELVPLGAGELVMRTAMDDMEEGGKDPKDAGTDEEDDSDNDGSPSAGSKKKKKSAKSKKGLAFSAENPDVSLYRGVGIKVRFSTVGENFMMSQLSGGQKALVALAMIFAIQRCDPAPFYIFDELDQALDSTYRQAVANLIQSQANSKDNPTQFITSTFRPELVAVARNCYGISHQNKVSRIDPMTKADALQFIGNLMKEEEALGEVASLPASHASRAESSARKRKTIEVASPGMEVEEGDEEEDAASPESMGHDEDGLITQP